MMSPGGYYDHLFLCSFFIDCMNDKEMVLKLVYTKNYQNKNVYDLINNTYENKSLLSLIDRRRTRYE